MCQAAMVPARCDTAALHHTGFAIFWEVCEKYHERAPKGGEQEGVPSNVGDILCLCQGPDLIREPVKELGDSHKLDGGVCKMCVETAYLEDLQAWAACEGRLKHYEERVKHGYAEHDRLNMDHEEGLVDDKTFDTVMTDLAAAETAFGATEEQFILFSDPERRQQHLASRQRSITTATRNRAREVLSRTGFSQIPIGVESAKIVPWP